MIPARVRSRTVASQGQAQHIGNAGIISATMRQASDESASLMLLVKDRLIPISEYCCITSPSPIGMSYENMRSFNATAAAVSALINYIDR